MKKVTASGHVEGGKLRIVRRDEFEREIASLAGPVQLIVERETRSSRANALYWVWCTQIGDELGYTKDEVHVINKKYCNPITILTPDKATGELQEETFAGDTHDLSIDAFTEFMNRVQRFWAEQNIILNSPYE